MNVYFAGSIRGGRADAELYRRIIARIQETDTVLTEHVGASVIRESDVDAEIYAKDTAWLREADLLIGECTCPSLGGAMSWLTQSGITCRFISSTTGLRQICPPCCPETGISKSIPTRMRQRYTRSCRRSWKKREKWKKHASNEWKRLCSNTVCTAAFVYFRSDYSSMAAL